MVRNVAPVRLRVLGESLKRLLRRKVFGLHDARKGDLGRLIYLLDGGQWLGLLMTMPDRLAILAQHLEAENAHDIDGIMATYAERPVVVINGRAIEGTDRVRLFHERFGFGGGGSFAEVHVEERHRLVTADAIGIEQTLSGRHIGDWEAMAPTGKRFEIAVCTVYRFAPDGLLQSEDVYFDRARLREQLLK